MAGSSWSVEGEPRPFGGKNFNLSERTVVLRSARGLLAGAARYQSRADRFHGRVRAARSNP